MAGVDIASLSVVVILGAKNPLVVEVRSRMAVAAGVVVPIPTVVNAPVFGVVEPIVPGAAQVFPVNDEALIVPVEV